MPAQPPPPPLPPPLPPAPPLPPPPPHWYLSPAAPALPISPPQPVAQALGRTTLYAESNGLKACGSEPEEHSVAFMGELLLQAKPASLVGEWPAPLFLADNAQHAFLGQGKVKRACTNMGGVTSSRKPVPFGDGTAAVLCIKGKRKARGLPVRTVFKYRLAYAEAPVTGGPAGALRRFFDKVTKQATTDFSGQRDGQRFFEALLSFDDPVDLLYRLNNPNEHGAARLKASLMHAGTPDRIAKHVVPLLRLLGSDQLAGSTCRAPLRQLLEALYRVPGLLNCVAEAVEAGAVAEAAPVGWWLLVLASQAEEVRHSPEVRRVAELLRGRGGDAAKVAGQLQVVLAGAQAGAQAGAGAAAGLVEAAAGGPGGSGVALEDLLLGPGGRHDNDHTDYRSIKIVPTSDEALSGRQPYLPRAGGEAGAGAGAAPPDPQAALLDRHFRLLREDFVLPLRQTLGLLGFRQQQQATANGGAEGGAGAGAPVVQGRGRQGLQVSVAQAQRNVYPLAAVVGVASRPRPAVLVAVELPMSHRAARMKKRKEREEYWDQYGKGTLPIDALVVVARRSRDSAGGGDPPPPPTPLLFGLVARREPKELAAERPVLGIAFDRGARGAEALLQELGRGGLKGEELVLVQVSTSFFSVRPVLAVLQALPGVPLAAELVGGQRPQPCSHLPEDAADRELSRLAASGVRLDPSQADSLRQCLSQRVALVQGPPGTGKTFLGVLLCDALLRLGPEQRILVVCYTNHALDQFLEALLDKGITGIVRALAAYNLRELTGRNSTARPRLDPAAFRRMLVLRDKGNALEARINHLNRLLNHTGGGAQPPPPAPPPPPQQQQGQGQQGQRQQGGAGASAPPPGPPEPPPLPPIKLWAEMEVLQDEHYEEWEQLGFGSGAAWRAWLQGYPAAEAAAEARGGGRGGADGGPEGEDGWRQQPVRQKASGTVSYGRAEGWLYEKIAEGANGGGRGGARGGGAPAAPPVVPAGGDVWSLPRHDRIQLAAAWLREQRQRWAEDLASALARSGEVAAEVRALHDGPARTVLSGARVIGCTTTGAAKYKELLRDPAVDLGVVLVEEAGELLEAHVLTSISERTKQLVLIGDHKQLRPKIDCYSLSVQSGAGHDLNVSLFERLVLGGFPHTQLGVQHRMHPQIANLVRPTYADLRDADSTRSRPPLMGLPPGQRVAFVDHREPEAGEREAGVWGVAAAAAGVSKVNMHEVALAVETVRYLLRQGYGPGQLVLLTPYLGQLLELQRALSRDMQVLLDELDLRDLRAAAAPQALAGLEEGSGPGGGMRAPEAGAGGGGARGGVRVATIDNYQGEEADVVVASLVRSNASGAVGFLREPERINVLLSRARHGMILIGNSETLRSAKSPEARQHWGRVLDALAAEGFVARGLPACCQKHGTRSTLDSPAAFAQHAPDGGCARPCHAVLRCGHPCLLRCHAFDPGHERIECGEEVLDTCSRGHFVKRRCSQAASDAVCVTCVEIRRIEKEERDKAAKLAAAADKARRDADLAAARLGAQIAQLRLQQAGLEEAARARQAAVALELERERLAKEVELQKKFGRLEAADREREQRRQAGEQLRAMEAEAEARAAAKLEEEAARQQQEREEEARRRSELEGAMRRLQEVEAARDRELQALANDRRRLGEQAEERKGGAEARATSSGAQYRTMAHWKQAVLAAARSKDPAAGLEGLRGALRAAVGGGQAAKDAIKDAAAALDAVFCRRGLGAWVVTYALSPASGQQGQQGQGPQGGAAAGAGGADGGAGGASLRRGVALLREDKWLDAYRFFRALAEQGQQGQGQGQDGAGGTSSAAAEPAPADVQAASALATLCAAKLGLPPPDAPPAAAAKPPQRKAPTPSPHPAQHLADALDAAAGRTPSPLGGGTGAVSAGVAAGAALAQATGAALAFLLHPAAAALPPALHAEAQRLFREGAPGLMGPASVTQAAAGSAGGSTGADGGGGGGGGQRSKWEAWAKKSDSMAALMALTGLAPVKQAMVELAAGVELDKERGRPLGSKQYNVRFYGNPGTGKTTVARIYAGLLKELGVLPGAEVVETSGAELLTGGVSKLKEQLKKLEKGGVLFLDEAYQLNPKTNQAGAQVLDYLLPEMENRRGKLVVALAGYRKQMDDLMAHNEGLPSRFVQEFTFPDYSDDELHTIFSDLIRGEKVSRFTLADPRHLRIAARRLGRGRGTPGFGNARAVRNAFEAAQRRQAARVLAERDAGGDPDPLRLEREDLLGPRHLDARGCGALRELRGMRGLAAVKQQVDDLLGLIATNAELEEAEQPPRQVNLNRIFLGNPGTGKTTVAGLYGRILRDLGLLSKGDVVVKVPADFVGSVLGESEKKTEAILEASRGCVLVIDEAYGLHFDGGRDPFREAVIDTIVARVQGVPGDDRCVLLLGYEEQMEAMLRNANPGLARRFQLPQAWRFEDYGPEDLLAITREAARKRGWALGEGALLAAVEALEAERRKPNFGNAGAVNNLLSAAAMRMEARLRGVSAAQRAQAVPLAEDFLPPTPGGDPADIFGDLIGCREVLQKLREWRATITACQALGRDPLQAVELNFRFTGAPGTGKTTVARRVGRLFASLGLLGSAELVACSASDFVTGYANQASGKTRELFKKAVGGVLFIDEAYRLNPRNGGPMMQEVLDEIVQLLTEPAYKDKMVVILAGYDNEIEELMAVNPGLKSRFSQLLHFPDFTAPDAAALLRQQLGRDGLELAAEVTQAALEGMAEQLVSAPNWANGRDVGTWAKRAFTQHALALGQGQGGAGAGAGQGVGLAALRSALEEMLRDKAPRAAARAGGRSDDADAGRGMAPQQQAPAFARAPPPPVLRMAPPATRPSVHIEEVTEDPAAAAPDVEMEEAAAVAPPTATGKRGRDFGGLSDAFLGAMQDALEAKGHDLSSLDAVRDLAQDPALANQILPYLSMPGVNAATLAEMVRQWQIMIRQRMEQEAEAARKRKRPVWRCAVCGRYGCPVAPYIERYEEVP
ncbi:hypothetical protein HYH03_009275 [Edaphochlamys debaryana]|uniref:AAA+ ATPase domain-containing protein n=1 Tax=Edaphochlamys debaryana TaxID=47281 RepID=A0A836BYK2_9CHLO|nr:hypothetical protein HYH03_009275 [Edaphochlamys debaryana]|eukprot:KAG2492324.1 hypothetical protein HYH03_009275 [Edaphochlamys debaryana]